jgi:hypothetical protein
LVGSIYGRSSTKIGHFDNGKSYLSFNSLGKSYLSFNREDFFRNQPIINKNCLWQPCLLTDRDKMTNLCTGNSCFWLADFSKSSPLKPLDQMNRNLNASYQVSMVAMFANRSGRNEQSS